METLSVKLDIVRHPILLSNFTCKFKLIEILENYSSFTSKYIFIVRLAVN